MSRWEHYLADADSRGRDPEYRAMQNGELLNLIRLLREDALIEHGDRVHAGNEPSTLFTILLSIRFSITSLTLR
jgi:hypothetical protein